MGASEELLALAKLQAWRVGRAVLVAHALHVDPDPDAAILAPLKMAGEERLWAVAYGRRGDAPRVALAADPRFRDDETERVLVPLLGFLDAYLEECAQEERAPQVWVSSRAAVMLIDHLADRRASRDERVALLGRHLWFLADRYHHPGQQVLLPATEVLALHFATGQSATEDAHLGAMLAWIEPPPGVPAQQAARVAEELPAGVLTDVERVDAALEDRLTELARLRRENRDRQRRERIVRDVERTLEPEALRIYELIERAIRALERQGLPPVAGIEQLRAADLEAFEFYRRRGFIPTRWSAKEAAQQLAKREEAVGRAEQVLLADPFRQAVAREMGEVVDARIVNLEEGPRAGSFHHVDLETDQAVSRIRPGDVLRLSGDGNIRVQVLRFDPPDEAGKRRLRCLVQNGKTRIGARCGQLVRLLPADGGGYGARALSVLRDVHDARPWVLDPDAPLPPERRRPAPRDPLAALKRLR